MKRKQLLLAVPVLAFVAGLAYVNAVYVGPATETTGGKMTAAAEKFLNSLTEDQRKTATFAFDDKERTNWHFIPLQDKDKKSTRKGLRLENMTAPQKEAARELLRSGASEQGYKAATTIMVSNPFCTISKGTRTTSAIRNGISSRFLASRPKPANGAGVWRAITSV